MRGYINDGYYKYDRKIKTISFPLITGDYTVTKRRIRYRFTGKCFENLDKLQLLKLITFDTTTLASQLKNLENFGKSEITFRKNHIRIGKSKYRYEDDKLIRK